MERTVLVTGASSAVGRATVAEFCDEEWTVYAAARDEAGRSRLPDRPNARRETLDVTDRRDVARVVERITDETDRVDALVTLPGRPTLGPLEDTPTAAVERQFDAVVAGYHRLLRATLPEMRRRQNGSVVTVTSAAADTAFPGGGAYSGAHAALAAATDALRREVPDGIDVVTVEPGPVGVGDTPGEAANGTTADDDATDTDGETSGDTRGGASRRGVGGRAGGVAVAPDDRTAAYDDVYGLVDDWGKLGADNPLSVSPAAVASAIVNAASATDPAVRYPVGPVARLAGLARLLPPWLTDAGWRLARRLG